MQDKMNLAVNAAVSEYRASLARRNLLNGGASLDAKRPNSWCEFGFPETLGFDQFFGLYRRGGVAHGAVNKLYETCWKTFPEVIEGEPQDENRELTRWERRIQPLFRRGKFWRALREADRRRLIGRYSALLLQFGDSRAWSEPVARGTVLKSMIPTWANCIEPTETDSFGNVLSWTYTGANGSSTTVHPERVFLIGDTSPDAVGFLEPAFNNFVSLEKVEGGSAESFLKNAARQMHVDFSTDVDLSDIAAMYGVPMDELLDRFNEAAREINRANDLLFVTQGAKTTPMVSSVPDPRPTFDVNLQSASCAVDIPSRILVGNQQGERASTEDRAYFMGRCQARRAELGVEIAELMEHLMALRVVPVVAEFSVVWDDLTESADSDKLSNARTMSEINAMSIDAEPPFDVNEVRVAAGYEPRQMDDPLPELDDEDEAAPSDPAE